MDDGLTYGDVEGFVAMLTAACEDVRMNESLKLLLSQPDDRRRLAVRFFLDRFRNAGAPRSLQEAFVCLLDDSVAEKAYEVIHRCGRG